MICVPLYDRQSVIGVCEIFSTRPNAFDGIDLVQLETIAAEIVSTSRGKKAEQAAVPGARAASDEGAVRAARADGPNEAASQVQLPAIGLEQGDLPEAGVLTPAAANVVDRNKAAQNPRGQIGGGPEGRGPCSCAIPA